MLDAIFNFPHSLQISEDIIKKQFNWWKEIIGAINK